MVFTRFGKVVDACVRAHEHVVGMQAALEELGTRLWHVYAAHGCLGQCVGRYQCQAVDAHVVDAVDRLQHFAHPLETL